MVQVLALILVLSQVLWGCTGQQAPASPPEALVTQVLDGDTVVLDTGHKVRLVGIDTPELEREGKPADFLAHKAKKVLADLALNQKVRLEYDQLRYDRFGRLLAHLFLPDGRHLNRELVAQGLARVYTIPPNVKYREELLAAQREAIQSRRGIWLKALEQTEAYYLGNRKSLIFHRPACPQGEKTAPGNRVTFPTILDAYLEGYSPCRTCKP